MQKYDIKDIETAKKKLLNHGVVAFPTETVMGLGVVYNDYQAYQKMNLIKQRPEDKPYTMMVKNKKEIEKYALINESTQRVIDTFMPGSITILVPVKPNAVPDYVTHGGSVIGIRIPTNEEAIALLNAIELPLLVPSANKSGSKPTINSVETKAVFGGELDYIIPGEAKLDLPSTIVDLTKEVPVVVREGPISLEDIRKAYFGL